MCSVKNTHLLKNPSQLCEWGRWTSTASETQKKSFWHSFLNKRQSFMKGRYMAFPALFCLKYGCDAWKWSSHLVTMQKRALNYERWGRKRKGDWVFLFFLILERGRESVREKETLICCSTYLCLHLLIPVHALTRDQTCSFGILGWCSN